MLIAFIFIGLIGCEAMELDLPRSETSFIVEFAPILTHISDGRQVSLGMHRDEIGNILSLQHVTEYGATHWYEGLLISYNDDKVTSIVVSIANNNWLMSGILVGDNIQNIIDSVRFMNLDYNIQITDEDIGFITGSLAIKYDNYVFGFTYQYDTGHIIMTAIFSDHEDLDFFRF